MFFHGRDEAFQIAKMRKEKIEEFQRNRAELDLKLKQDRTEAIKRGESNHARLKCCCVSFHRFLAGQEALKQMRFDVKNVMFHTKLELKVGVL